MATYSGQGVDIPITASGDLDTAQYRFVMPATTAKKVLQATGGSSPTPLGVLQNDPRDGEAGAVRIIGTTKVYGNTACGAITYGDWITSGSDGMAVLSTGAGSQISGLALEALSSGSGVLIEALLLITPTSGCGIVDNTP
jgi:hypothetical protein